MAKNVFSVYPAFADSDIAGTAAQRPVYILQRTVSLLGIP